MYSRILKLPEQASFFLFGPRGTGKSTWLKQQFPQATYLDFLHTRTYTQLLAQPQQIKSFIPQSSKLVILDEIQRIPNLLNEVHRLIENEKIRFILTGSNARKLKRTGVNLLAGRAHITYLFPLTVEELGEDFDLRFSLQYGFLPSVIKNPDPKGYLKSYVHTYLREEVLQESLVRNLSSFTRFLQAASYSQASVLNVSDIARDCQVERKVVENYFTILEDLLIAERIPVFSKRSKRDLITHRKFFYFDTGVYRTLKPQGPLDSNEEMDGASLETLFYQQLKAVNHYCQKEYEIFFWRTRNQLEVDFVLYGPQGFHAFEVKRSSNYKSKDLTALKEFGKDYPQAKLYFLYGGSYEREEDGIRILPFEIALKNLSTIL